MTSLSGFGSLAAIPEEKITDKITRRVLAGQKGMMWWKIGAGTHVATHSHPHEQLVWVVKGRMDFRIDKERRALEAGGIATILGGVEHEGYLPRGHRGDRRRFQYYGEAGRSLSRAKTDGAAVRHRT